MKGVKVPGMENFCFNIPLRVGLLAFSYISLGYHFLFFAAEFLFTATMDVFLGGNLRPHDLLWFAPVPLLVGLMVYNMLVIVATHKNNARGIKTSIVIGTLLWILTIPFCVCLGYNIVKYAETEPPLSWHLAVVILEPCLQGYVLLLIRSLKLKLQAEGKFEYINF